MTSATSTPRALSVGVIPLLATSLAAAQTAGLPLTPDRLEEVTVTGRKIEHYLAIDALTGTKSNALLRDLPITVSVVPHDLVEDRGIARLGEALDNIAGAQRKQGYGGVENFGAFLRGFDASFLTLRNGIRDYGFYTLRDTANVERFEVLKGPGSVLYGAVYPGGITNTITKKPVAQPLAHIEAEVGSYDRYRAEADVGGPLTESIFYRLNLAYEDAESFRDQVGNEGFFVAPVATWVISDRTNITAEIEHKRSEYTWDLGLPRSPLSLQVPIERFLGEPDGLNEVESTYVSGRVEHRLTDRWKLRQVLGYAWTDGDYGLRSPLGIAANGRTVNRTAYDTWEKSKTSVSQSEIVGDLAALGVSHNLVAGIEYYETQQSYSFFLSPLAAIDLLSPVYRRATGIRRLRAVFGSERFEGNRRVRSRPRQPRQTLEDAGGRTLRPREELGCEPA